MDGLELIAALEGLRDKIPATWSQDFEDLIANIRNTYEMSTKYVTPPEPVHVGRQNLAAHHATLDSLCVQLGSGLETFQQVYIGSGSDAYRTRAAMSLQNLQLVRDHLATASALHNTMAINFDTATEAKLALVALLAGLAVTLGVLIASAGTTAPITIPAAAFEIAGGAISIGLMTEAEIAAAGAIMGLLWAGLPDALLVGLAAMATTDVLGHIALHPPTVQLPNRYYTGNSNRKDTANQQEKAQFEYAWKEIQRRLHKKLSKADRRRLHDEITKQGFTPEEIIAIGLSMFGD
jgi:hypothetical protein